MQTKAGLVALKARIVWPWPPRRVIRGPWRRCPVRMRTTAGDSRCDPRPARSYRTSRTGCRGITRSGQLGRAVPSKAKTDLALCVNVGRFLTPWRYRVSIGPSPTLWPSRPDSFGPGAHGTALASACPPRQILLALPVAPKARIALALWPPRPNRRGPVALMPRPEPRLPGPRHRPQRGGGHGPLMPSAVAPRDERRGPPRERGLALQEGRGVAAAPLQPRCATSIPPARPDAQAAGNFRKYRARNEKPR